jgi:hypothetical protein
VKINHSHIFSWCSIVKYVAATGSIYIWNGDQEWPWACVSSYLCVVVAVLVGVDETDLATLGVGVGVVVVKEKAPGVVAGSSRLGTWSVAGWSCRSGKTTAFALHGHPTSSLTGNHKLFPCGSPRHSCGAMVTCRCRAPPSCRLPRPRRPPGPRLELHKEHNLVPIMD